LEIFAQDEGQIDPELNLPLPSCPGRLWKNSLLHLTDEVPGAKLP
jgi:hypothetical protein